MSFPAAEATEPALAGLSPILRDAHEVSSYLPNPHQVYDNMDTDPLIAAHPTHGKPASRLELLQRVSVHGTNIGTIKNEVVSFCRSHLQEGPLDAAAANATLGRLHRKAALAHQIADPASPTGLADARAKIDELIDFMGTPPARLALQRAELAGRVLSRFQMWVYPAADPADPFQEIGTTRAEGVNVLGLGHFHDHEPTAELVRWAHTLPDPITAHQPSAWDAGAAMDNVYWRPGGHSWRLDQTGPGLPELVHDPISGDHLAAPIEPLS